MLVTCQSVVLADLLNNLVRAGRGQAGNNAHGQGGQGIGGGTEIKASPNMGLKVIERGNEDGIE